MIEFVNEALAGLESDGRLRDVRPVPGGVVSFASNDYLGLSGHRSVRDAVIAAVGDHGMGPRGSALICGHTEHHAALESALAAFVNKRSAVLTPTGYAANLAVLDALASGDLHVFSDELNHASIVDACHRARRRGSAVDVYSHGDTRDLERRIAASDRKYKLVVTETVFSMDGDLAPLVDIAALRDTYGFTLVTDESHATLVFGATGAGVAEQLGVVADIHVGTASKAIGAIGGFVACDEPLARLLRSSARTYVFSTALPIPIVAAIRAALELDHATLRERLWSNTRRFCRAIGREAISPIVPIVLGDERETVAAGRRLLDAGFLVAAVRPPTVPEGTSRLRVTISAAHEADQIDTLAASLPS